MVITAGMVKELREMTGAGMMDCKKALSETNGDMDAAVEFLRKNGQAKAEKKAGRIAAEGIVKTVVKDNKAAIVEVNSETDFVAKNDEFQGFVETVVNQIVDSEAADMDAFMAEAWAADTTKTVKDALVEKIAVIGENLNIRRFEKVAADNGCVVSYIHGGGRIGVLVVADTDVVNDDIKACLKNVAMQVAAMRPVALDESSVSEETKKSELEVAVAKTKEELVEKAVNAALKKAGINPAHVDSEEHIESNTKKGWLTPEQAEEARNIKKTVGEEKAATLNPTMIQNIANGRLAKFFKENCLVDQEFQFGDGDKQTVAQYLASQSKDLKIVAYQRFTLAAE